VRIRILTVLILFCLTAASGCVVHIDADLTMLTPAAIMPGSPLGTPLPTPAAKVLPTVTSTPAPTGAFYSPETDCDHILKGDTNSILEQDFIYDPGDDRYPYIVMGPEDIWFCTEAYAAQFGFEPYEPEPQSMAQPRGIATPTSGTVTPIPPEVEAQEICAIKAIAGIGYVGIFYEPLDREYADIVVNEENGD
jgi:hypothetical protein